MRSLTHILILVLLVQVVRIMLIGETWAVQAIYPKSIHFPPFTGDQPKLWITCCEEYFDMYSVAPSLWVRVSSIHVSLGCCLTMVANHGVSNSHHIPSMVGILHHDSLPIWPGSARVANSPTVPYSPTSVPDYIDRFATLMDQLIAYGAHTDPLYFTMCFIR